jgi:hypothetical protein
MLIVSDEPRAMRDIRQLTSAVASSEPMTRLLVATRMADESVPEAVISTDMAGYGSPGLPLASTINDIGRRRERTSRRADQGRTRQVSEIKSLVKYAIAWSIRRRPGGRALLYGSSVMDVGPGPGAIRIGHCFESNGTGGGRNGVVPRLALSATMAARASPPINS